MLKKNLCALFVAMLIYCNMATAAPTLLAYSLPALEVGEPELDLRRLTGKVTLLLLFEDQCSYCLSMIQRSQALVQQNPEQYHLVLIGVGSDPKALIAWSNRVPSHARKVLANKKFLSALGGVKATPLLLIANARGEFAQKISGAVSTKVLRAALANVRD